MNERMARAWSRLLLILPWTRPGEMDRLIDLVADHHRVSREQAFALMYAACADGRERSLLSPYRPPAGGTR